MSAPRPPPLPWPPLVRTGRVPMSVRVRDIVLTWLAWLAFAWLLRDAAYLAYDWTRPPFGQWNHLAAPDWPVLWLRLRPFMQVVGVIAVWIAVWALVRRHALKTQNSDNERTTALDPALHGSRYSVSMPQLQAWQSRQVVTVDIDSAGHIVCAENLEPNTITTKCNTPP